MLAIFNLISFLILLGFVWWLITLFPLPHPIPTIIQVLFVILAVLAVVNVLTGLMLLGVSVPKIL